MLCSRIECRIQKCSTIFGQIRRFWMYSDVSNVSEFLRKYIKCVWMYLALLVSWCPNWCRCLWWIRWIDDAVDAADAADALFWGAYPKNMAEMISRLGCQIIQRCEKIHEIWCTLLLFEYRSVSGFNCCLFASISDLLSFLTFNRNDS